jgi:tRNA 2-thiouridine synthesizing protein E
MVSPILSAIEGKQLARNRHGELVEIEPWSRDRARAIAEREGLTLGDDHYRVLEYLRELALDQGGLALPAHKILRILEQQFAVEGGGRWLYELFPGGPLRQGMRLAGLPEPDDVEEPSFGSVR